MDPITEFTAAATSKANELQLKWKNPSDAVLVEISYALEVGGGDIPLTTNVRVYGEKIVNMHSNYQNLEPTKLLL